MTDKYSSFLNQFLYALESQDSSAIKEVEPIIFKVIMKTLFSLITDNINGEPQNFIADVIKKLEAVINEGVIKKACKKRKIMEEEDTAEEILFNFVLKILLKIFKGNIGQPEKPEAVIKNPEAVIEKPEAVIEKPEAVNEKPEAVMEKPEAVIEKVRKKRKIVEEDDTEETLQFLLQRLNNGESKNPPPDQIVSCIPDPNVEAQPHQFSRCIYKQLTESDVNGGQSRLMLGKKEVKDKFLCLLKESEIPGVEGIDVSVYGPDGKPHEMKFKMWNKDTPVLANGWSKFVKAYGLERYSYVLKIWMFRASEDHKICFVIDSNRFDDIKKQLSKRILKNVFLKS